MKNIDLQVIERGNAAVVFGKDTKTIIFESGNIYRRYGKLSDSKVKLIGNGKAPDFDEAGDPHFQRRYQYIGEVYIIKQKRSLVIQH